MSNQVCDTCEGLGYIENSCGICRGSGEGMYDGSTCYSCKGSGVETIECDECDKCNECSELLEDCVCLEPKLNEFEYNQACDLREREIDRRFEP